MRLFKRKPFTALVTNMVITSGHVVACSAAQHQSSKWCTQFYREMKKQKKWTKRKKRMNEIHEGKKKERKGGRKNTV